jgi:4-amino-4-deoxy-L-arabinose transferase-like glycosyltransferase
MATVRRHLPALGLILVAAAALRLIWIAWSHPDPLDGRFDDTPIYYLTAHYVAIGEGYLNPFTGTPTANWPPGYPVFLGAVFKAFGEGTTQAYIANVVLALATIVVVYVVGVRTFDRRTAIVAAAALALWPGQIYFTSLTLSEGLFTLLFTACVLLILLVPYTQSMRGALVLAFGVVLTAAMLTRGQALVLLPIAIVVWRLAGMQWRSAIGWGMLAAIALAVLLTPWVLRNERQLGSPVIIATNVGPNLWIGHNEGASGRMQVDDPIPVPDDPDLSQPEFEVRASNLALRRALRFMFTHPADEVRLSGAKVRALYESDATALDWNSAYDRSYYDPPIIGNALRTAANAYWFAALGIAGIGLVASRARLREPLAVLPLIVLAWTATHIVFFGEPRFHYPIVFVFALLAARGIVVLAEALRRPQPLLRKRYAAV